MRRATGVMWGLWMGLCAVSGPAFACEPLPCQSGYMLPMGTSEVPVNAPGLVWMRTNGGAPLPVGAPRDSGVSLMRRGGRGAKPVMVQVSDGTAERGNLLRPATEWAVGERYALSAPSACRYGSYPQSTFEAVFTVTPEVALPTGLGTVEVGAVQVGPLVVGTSSGSCSTEANTVYADVRLELSKEANPWRDLLEYETLVNGKRVVMSESINVGPQPWMSWVGRGKDRLYALCGDSHGFEGVGPGRHSVQFRARVAGTETVVLSEEATLELVCPGQSLPVLEEVLPDAQVPPSGSACGCATSQTLGWAWALALVGVVVRRRSRGQPTRGPDIASADQEVIDAHP